MKGEKRVIGIIILNRCPLCWKHQSFSWHFTLNRCISSVSGVKSSSFDATCWRRQYQAISNLSLSLPLSPGACVCVFLNSLKLSLCIYLTFAFLFLIFILVGWCRGYQPIILYIYTYIVVDCFCFWANIFISLWKWGYFCSSANIYMMYIVDISRTGPYSFGQILQCFDNKQSSLLDSVEWDRVCFTPI